jgi:predicted XRE-type DNA-binding protein
MGTNSSNALDPATPSAASNSASGNNIHTSPNDRDYPAGQPPRTEHNALDHTPANPNNTVTMAARRTLITAITRRITKKHLTAAQAASVLKLTGPRVTQLLNRNIDEFTVDELVNLLPALELTIQVVPEPQRHIHRPRNDNAASGGPLR